MSACCLSLSLLFILILVSWFSISLFSAQIKINITDLRSNQSCPLNKLLFTPKQNRKRLMFMKIKMPNIMSRKHTKKTH